MRILQDLYDSEINFTISCFWDGGFNWILGDSRNVIRTAGNVDTFAEAVNALRQAALKHYSKSAFAAKHGK